MSNMGQTLNKKWKILIVEDNPINTKVVSLFLDELGQTNSHIATTGNKAIELFDNTFDLVLLDIGLPDINGIDVCKRMRKYLNGKPLPIIAVTSFSDEETLNACLAAGIDKIIFKPLNFDNLAELLTHWLGS